MMMPPTTLMATISRPAMASPRTNLQAPSMAPKKLDFVFELLCGARARFVFVDQAGGKIGVDRHLLAGHGVQGEARRDFGDAARTFGDDDEVHDHQDREHDHADDEIALHDQLAEGLDHIAGRSRAFVAVAEDEARGGEVERQAHHRGDEQDRRETN